MKPCTVRRAYDHVFLTAWGGPIYPTTVTNLPRKLIEAHNKTTADKLPMIRLHDLRHLHATMLLLAGVPVHIVAAPASCLARLGLRAARLCVRPHRR
ncbi:hypothetical protein GCM10010404_32190 [Nonomuraea africana]